MNLNDSLRNASTHVMEVVVSSGIKSRDFTDDVGDVRKTISNAIGAQDYSNKARYIEDAMRQIDRLKIAYDFDARSEYTLNRAHDELDSAYFLVETKRRQMAVRKKGRKSNDMLDRAVKYVTG